MVDEKLVVYLLASNINKPDPVVQLSREVPGLTKDSFDWVLESKCSGDLRGRWEVG